jgi:hypothetical protein
MEIPTVVKNPLREHAIKEGIALKQIAERDS